MAYRYQGNQQGWSGHRGRGGNFQGHQGRGGSWQSAEYQRTFDGHGERGHWYQQSMPGPSEFNQDWHQRESDQTQKYLNVESPREGSRCDRPMNQGSSFGVSVGNPMIQSPGQANVWQKQQENANRTSRWPDQDQTLVQNRFAPVHHGAPAHVNEYPGAPQQMQHQEQVQPESIAPLTSIQPQFSRQQSNRSQLHPMENSGSNPMITSQAFHPPQSSSVPPRDSTHDTSMPWNRQERLSHNQHIPAAEQCSGEVITQGMFDEKWVAQFVSEVRLKSPGSPADDIATVMPVTDGRRTVRQNLMLLTKLEQLRDSLITCMDSDDVTWQQECNKAKQLKVTDGRRAIRHYLMLLTKIEQLRDSLITCMDSDDVTWQQECNKAKQLKVQLDKAQEKIQEQSFVTRLSEQVVRIRRKRASIGRRKKRRYLAYREEEDRKRRVTEKIDAVLAKEQKAIQDAKNETALQKEVDSTLFEVRKKKQDADKTLEMLRALCKLRNVRKEAAAQKGAYTSSESDGKFEDGVSRLETLMNEARSTYREEEQTLLVMLEEEQEENKGRQMEIIRQRQRESALKAVQKRKEILFGKDDPVGPDDSMFPFQQFYSQAESDLPSLMEIRRHWNIFLVHSDDPNASGIPTDWVIPSVPSSKEWASTLQDL